MNIAVYSRANFRNNLMGSDIYKFQILNNILSRLPNNYDFIFIDCPPNLNYITQNALYISDYYLIPTVPDKLSSYGILSITNKVKELNQAFSSASTEFADTKLIGIVPNNIREYAERPKESQSNVLSTIRGIFPNNVFESYLTYGDGITKASALGYPVFAFEDTHQNAEKQGKLIRNILRELLRKIGGDTNS